MNANLFETPFLETLETRKLLSISFVNGVLRNFLREPNSQNQILTDATVPSLAVHYSHPEWLVQRWMDDFGADAARALMRANNERAPLILRATRVPRGR